MSKKPDYILLITTAVLVFFGLIMIASAGIVLSHENFNQPYFYLKSQLTKGLGVGVLLAFCFYFLPLKIIKKFAFPAFLANLLLLVLIFFPGIGLQAGGARRWLDLGVVAFQPTEVLKLTIILYLAAWFEKKGEAVKDLKEGFLPFLLLLSIPGVLIAAQPDIGTLGIIVFISILIFFAAGARISHLATLGGIGAGVLLLAANFLPHVANRLKTFIDPSTDPQGIGYQIKQAVIAIGSGGIFGVGLSQSLQKYKYLPEPVGDSIMAIIGEEFGFLGLIFLLVLFGIFAYRGLKIAKGAPDKFTQLTAIGITGWIVLQAGLNISAICGLAPLTGMPLPFISYGSTSLAFSLAGVGLLLNISKQAKI